jgi:glycosyltransferase involved in cell wall biosynthesis
MPPYTSAGPSAALARRLDVPWIADLGDPWALDEMMIYPTRFHRAAVRSEMRAALRTAAAVVMSTPEAVARVRSTFPELRDRPVVAIPNGYDASDFDGDIWCRPSGRFRIVHTGYLHTDLGRGQHRRERLRRVAGGHVRGVDVLTRSHVYLLAAVERLLDESPTLADRLELVFAGVLSETDRALAERLSVTRLPGYLAHAESVALIRSADLLFLPMQKLPQGMRSATIPGKTYEYVASGRPILAAVPEGDARDLVLAAGNGLVCDPDDVDTMVEIIRRQMDERPASTAPANVDAYEYRQLAGRVAALLDEIAHEPTK